MKRVVYRAALAAALTGCVWLAAAAQPKTAAQAPIAEACPTPWPQAATFHSFHWDYPILRESDFRALRVSHTSAFGRAFLHEMSLRKIAALFSIYGYDFISTREGYMLFYRRPVGWVQTTSLPRISAPNGELLPPLQMPGDMDPRWPSPWLLTHSTPFAGVIILPQQIVAYPCSG